MSKEFCTADATGSEFYNVYSNRAASSLKLSRFFEELEFERLTSAQRTRVFIVDNSVMNRQELPIWRLFLAL